MMSGVGSPVTNITYAECRQRAATITVDDHRIELDLAAAADPDSTTYRSRSIIAFTARAERDLGGPDRRAGRAGHAQRP